MAFPFDTTNLQNLLLDLAGKSQSAFEKSSIALDQAGDLAEGNLDAAFASTKVFTAGVRELGATKASEAREAFNALGSDMRALAAAKSPTEFFQLQTALARKQFEVMVSQATKNAEAAFRLAGDTAAPLAGRMAAALEKVGTAL